jgi:hypothetical protein
MAEILIRTLTHCVGNLDPGGPEITLPKGRIVNCEEGLARKFIALEGAVEANEADLAAQEARDAEQARIEAMKATVSGHH